MDKKHRRRVFTVLFFIANISLYCLPIILVQALSQDEPFTINHRLRTKMGSVWVMGEIINNLDVSVGDVNVRVTFYDNDHRIMKESSMKVWLSVLLPQRRGSFIVSVDDEEVEGFADYTVEVEDYEPCEDKPVGLAFADARLWSRSSTDATVKGVIANQGSQETNFILIIVFFYDSNGLLALEATTLSLDEGLLPGTGKEFSIRSTFVNESSPLVKCILTAESAGDPSGTQFAAYAITQERVVELTEPVLDQSIVIILVVISLGSIAVIITAKKWKRKTTYRAKRRISSRRTSKSRLYDRSNLSTRLVDNLKNSFKLFRTGTFSSYPSSSPKREPTKSYNQNR